MCSKPARFLTVKIGAGGKRRFRLRLPPIALYVVSGAVMGFDGYFEFIPGNAGRKARGLCDALLQVPNAMRGLDVDVSAGGKNKFAKIRVKAV